MISVSSATGDGFVRHMQIGGGSLHRPLTPAGAAWWWFVFNDRRTRDARTPGSCNEFDLCVNLGANKIVLSARFMKMLLCVFDLCAGSPLVGLVDEICVIHTHAEHVVHLPGAELRTASRCGRRCTKLTTRRTTIWFYDMPHARWQRPRCEQPMRATPIDIFLFIVHNSLSYEKEEKVPTATTVELDFGDFAKDGAAGLLDRTHTHTDTLRKCVFPSGCLIKRLAIKSCS